MPRRRIPSGVPILRHRRRDPGPLATPDAERTAAVAAHLAEHIGPASPVWPDAAPHGVAVELLAVAPQPGRPVLTLVTAGSSGDAELLIVLRPEWPTPGDPTFSAARWPYQLLRDLARLPLQYDTKLEAGQTVANGDPPAPYGPGTDMCGALIAPPVIPDDALPELTFGGRRIGFHAVYPLHADELEVKLQRGTDALLDLLDEAEITEVLHPDRPSVVRP